MRFSRVELPDFRYQKLPDNRDIFVVKRRLDLNFDRLTADRVGKGRVLYEGNDISGRQGHTCAAADL
jgi:hypothetical protein